MKTVIFLLLVAALSGCDSKPATFQAIGHGRFTVNPDNYSVPTDTLVLQTEIQSAFDMGSQSEYAIKDIRQYFPTELDKYQTVWVLGTAKFSDKYGNSAQQRVLGIEWAKADILKMNIEAGGITTFDLLNLATDLKVFNDSGRQLLNTYCTDDANFKFTKAFCIKALPNR